MKSAQVHGHHRRRRAAMEQTGQTTRRSPKQGQQAQSGNWNSPDGDVTLAKLPTPQRQPLARKPAKRKPSTRKPARPKAKDVSAGGGVSATKRAGALADLLSPKNIQESLKSVGNLRGVVKNCLNYLQQADQMLDTFYATSNSLRETGVLDKIVKNRGKNLTTEDFTGILAALMSSPLGGQLFKAMNGGEGEAAQTDTSASQP